MHSPGGGTVKGWGDASEQPDGTTRVRQHLLVLQDDNGAYAAKLTEDSGAIPTVAGDETPELTFQVQIEPDLIVDGRVVMWAFNGSGRAEKLQGRPRLLDVVAVDPHERPVRFGRHRPVTRVVEKFDGPPCERAGRGETWHENVQIVASDEFVRPLRRVTGRLDTPGGEHFHDHGCAAPPEPAHTDRGGRHCASLSAVSFVAPVIMVNPIRRSSMSRSVTSNRWGRPGNNESHTSAAALRDSASVYPVS